MPNLPPNNQNRLFAEDPADRLVEGAIRTSTDGKSITLSDEEFQTFIQAAIRREDEIRAARLRQENGSMESAQSGNNMVTGFQQVS